MKVVIIVLILIVLGFVVAIGVGVVRAAHPPANDGSPRTNARGEIDKEALEDWEPPAMAAVMGKLGAPFAPKLLKRAVRVSGQAASGESGTPGTLAAAPSDKDMRIARLKLLSGAAARVTYEGCRQDEEGGRTCPQVVCLCSLGETFDEDDVDDCPDPWRKARTPEGGDRLKCRPENDDAGTLIVYPEGGVIKIEPLAGDTATVQIR